MPKLEVTLTDTQTDNELKITVELDDEDARILDRMKTNPIEYEGHVLSLLNDVMLVEGKMID